MRMEAKVYMSHTDMYRIQSAARKMGMTLSGYMRWCALTAADGAGIPEYRELEHQGILPLELAQARAADDDAKKGVW